MGLPADHTKKVPDEDVDACDADFKKGDQTKDEDLPVAFGGEA